MSKKTTYGPRTDAGRSAIGQASALRAAKAKALKDVAAAVFARMSDEELAAHGLRRVRLEIPAGTVVVYDADGLPLVEWRHA